MKCFHSQSTLPASTGFGVVRPLLAGLLLVSSAIAHERCHAEQSPPVPADLQVPTGNELAFRATGVGVQIYVWAPSPTDSTVYTWTLKAPHAVLFRHGGDVVGIHFGGPTWENNDGSKIGGKRLAGVTVDPNAIPWLLLQGVNPFGTGVFADVTYIQRLNTVGGLAPTTPGAEPGQEVLVPYMADYLLYHAKP